MVVLNNSPLVLIIRMRGSDYYRIYCEKNGNLKEEYHDIGVEELDTTLDLLIKTGGLCMKKYKKKVFERYYLKFRGQMLSLAQDFFERGNSSHF